MHGCIQQAAGHQLPQEQFGDNEERIEQEAQASAQTSLIIMRCVAVVTAADDPFSGLLNSHSSSSSRPPRQQQQHHLPPDPLTDSSTTLAANFTPQDVTNLLHVLFNEGVAQELRRAAADELLALSPVPQLLGLMVEDRYLEQIWQLCVPNW